MFGRRFAMVVALLLASLTLSCSQRDAEPANPADSGSTQAETASTDATAPALGKLEVPETGYRAIFLDVGQGDATLLLSSDGRAMLIDAGASPALIIQRLVALDLKTLDAVVATHADADHIGGMAAVINHFEVKKVYWNGLNKKTQVFEEFWAAAKDASPQVLQRCLLYTSPSPRD